MTKRERYLRALRNEPVDELVWAPNFDYWMAMNWANGTAPKKYEDMSRNDIVRSIGGCIWNRAVGLKTVTDASVRSRAFEENGARVHEVETPVGTIRQVYEKTEGEHTSRYLAEHFIKDLDSLEVMSYVVQATHYEADYDHTLRALDETGDDGVVLNAYFSIPFIQFAKMDAGYVHGYYMWSDYRKEVDSLIELYFASFLQGFNVLAEGPADVIATGDNMDGVMISPAIFHEYAAPFYQEVRKAMKANGKIFEGHWCGRTKNILPITPGCGLDVVEAIVTTPMDDMTLEEALGHLKGEVVLQGGVPAVLVCDEGGTFDDFVKYIQDVIVPMKGRRGFILGMSDNVPPNADFSRVEAIAELIK